MVSCAIWRSLLELLHMNKLVVHRSSIVHKNPWYKIRKDELTWANGKPGEYYVAEFPGAVMLVCIDNDRVLVVDLYRHALGCMSIEFPGGRLDADESLEQAGQRELEEETGLKARMFEYVGKYSSLNGAARMWGHVFLATDFEHGTHARDESEEGMHQRWVAIRDWEAMIARNEVTDGETLAAWMLYRAKYPR